MQHAPDRNPLRCRTEGSWVRRQCPGRPESARCPAAHLRSVGLRRGRARRGRVRARGSKPTARSGSRSLPVRAARARASSWVVWSAGPGRQRPCHQERYPAAKRCAAREGRW